MCRKTPAVAFITRLIKTTGRAELIELLNNSPLKSRDIALLLDYADGVSYKELADKYGKTEGAIYAQKRKIVIHKKTNKNEKKRNRRKKRKCNIFILKMYEKVYSFNVKYYVFMMFFCKFRYISLYFVNFVIFVIIRYYS